AAASHTGALAGADDVYEAALRRAGVLRVDTIEDLFDAVELNALYTRFLDFNRRAVVWARAQGKPLVGNADVHRLGQLGTTWSLVDAEPDPDEICAAIKAGRVELRTTPISVARLVYNLATVMPSGILHAFGVGRGG
ncbi:MAG: PHP-associated domain-containing protein, partial [Vicinamibacterales bacterium]|nr:PHP-associated domain-containing protein [Vicinamibacterales bacterium]